VRWAMQRVLVQASSDTHSHGSQSRRLCMLGSSVPYLWQDLGNCRLQALQARHGGRWQRRAEADEDGPRLRF
jgi:hypothetical protein